MKNSTFTKISQSVASLSASNVEERKLTGYFLIVIGGVAAAFSAFYIYTSIFGLISGEMHRGVFFLVTMVLTFMVYPANARSPLRPSIIDIALSIAAVVIIFYWMSQYGSLQQRLGWQPLTIDVAMGGILILLSLESARRTTGYAIPLLSIFFLFYAYQGQLFPGLLWHRGYSIGRIVEFAFVTSEGMLGTISNIFATYVFIFIVFGAFLIASGLGNLFVNLSYALTGDRTGGPGLTAVICSGIFGSISGSPNANVATTGVFTIPLMKRVGYEPHFAAAVEAAASTGGAYMPPLMGAAAFIIAEFTETPYIEIVKISVLPAFLYFLSVGLFVYIQARKKGLTGVPKSELPSKKEMVKKLYLLIPIPLMVYLLVIGFSPFYAASIGIFATVAISWISKETRMGLKSIYNALVEGAMNTLSVGSLTGALGIILGMSLLTGLPNRFAGFLLEVSGGNLPLVIFIVILAGYVIGMGLPITPAYILVSLFCVPALTQLGITTLTSHMISFWVAVNSVVTPPVALAAYAAAAIAKADFLKTAFLATKLASWLYLMPFLFVYTPILEIGSIPIGLAIRVIVSCIFGVIAWVVAAQGFMFKKINWFMRIILFSVAFLLLESRLITDIAGAVVIIAFFIHQKYYYSKNIKQEVIA